MERKEKSSGRFLSPSARAVVVLGAVLIIGVLAMTSYEIWRQRSNALTSAQNNLQALSLALAEQTERAFHSIELVVDATVAALERQGGLANARSEEMHAALRERSTGVPVMLGLGIIDANGHVVTAARSYPPPAGPVAAEREYFLYHKAHADNALHVGTPVQSPLDGSWLVPVTRRLSGPEGSFQGVVLAAVNPTYFEQFYSRVLPGGLSAFTLFRSDATLLARYPDAGGKIGQNFAHLKVFEPELGDAGLLSGPSPIDGRIRHVSFNKLKNYPLVLLVSLAEDQILAQWRENTARLALAAVLAVLILTAAVVVLYRQLARQESQAHALKRSEERLTLAQFALDHAADMVLWLDHDGRVLYANDTATASLGYDHGEIRSLGVGDIAPRLGPLAWAALLAEISGNRLMRLETEFRTHDGTVFPIEIALNYVDFSRADFVCAFARDITERRAAEAALAEKTASLEASNAELEQFAYVASHDLREPLRMVNSFVTILARRYADKLDKDGQEFIAFAQEGAVRMDRLILDLLEYSRVGRIERPFAPTPLGRVVDVAIKGLMVAADEAGASITVESDLPMVTGSEQELVRLFLNLVGNAVKYRNPDRPCQVRISAHRHGDEIECRVSDNGIGIAPEYFERIFRIFQRLHGRDKYEGTGIGLAICKKIVERHGGRIWVESVPEQGSTFCFTLKPAE